MTKKLRLYLRKFYSLSSHHTDHLYGLALILLLIVSFYFRFVRWYRFDNLLGDEGVQLVAIDNLIRFGQPIAQGEISALDLNSKYILYNSTLGLYWLAFSYLLGGMSPEGYTYITFIFSLIKIGLLFKTAEYTFGKKAGLITLLFGGLAIGEIYNSSWPSQPNNAQFFETVSLFFLALYFKKKNEDIFTASVASSLIASQMYPPMYFLLLLKIPYYFYLLLPLKKKIRHLTLTAITLVVVLMPLVIFELGTNYYNLHTVTSFLTQQTSSTETHLFSSTNLVQSLTTFGTYLSGTVRILASQYHPFLYGNSGLILSAFFVIALGYITYYAHPFTPVSRKLLHYFFTLVISITCIIALLITISGSSSERAYIFIIQPYILILMGVLFSRLRPAMYSLSVTIICMVGLYTAYFYSQFPVMTPSIHDIRQVSQLISEDMKDKGISIDEMALHVISPADRWSWDASIYWYELAHQSSTPTVKVNKRSKIELIQPKKEKRAYFICFGQELLDDSSEDTCWHIFQTQTYDKYELDKVITFSTQKVYYVTPWY